MAFHAHEHLGRRSDQLLVAQLQQKFVRAGTALLNPLEQRRRALGIIGLEGLPQDHFVVFALPHAFAHRFHFGHVLFGLVVAVDFVVGPLGRTFAPERQCGPGPAVVRPPSSKFVTKALDLLLLAIHVVNVVAEKELQILHPVARKLQMDGIELEQQIVSKRAHQREPGVLIALEFADQRAQNRKRRGLLAAFFFGEQLGQWLQTAMQRGALKAEVLPMRMAFKEAMQHPVQNFPARVERPKLHILSRSHDFDGRADGSHIPARVPLRIFIAG